LRTAIEIASTNYRKHRAGAALLFFLLFARNTAGGIFMPELKKILHPQSVLDGK